MPQYITKHMLTFEEGEAIVCNASNFIFPDIIYWIGHQEHNYVFVETESRVWGITTDNVVMFENSVVVANNEYGMSLIDAITYATFRG